MLIAALPSKLAVPVTAPLTSIALGVASLVASAARVAAEAVPVNAPTNPALVSNPVLGLYINPLSCFTAVSAPVVVLAK
jgi:hypothetical protein